MKNKYENLKETVVHLVNKSILPTGTGLITPETPFSNKEHFVNVFNLSKKYIYWIDKYFTKMGLNLLLESIDPKRVKTIRILTSIDKVDEKIKENFKDFKKELKYKNVSCDLRVITDNKIKSSIHDRWIITDGYCYNVPSTDTLARGQYSEIKPTLNRLPFKDWWEKSKDISKDWDEISSKTKVS